MDLDRIISGSVGKIGEPYTVSSNLTISRREGWRTLYPKPASQKMNPTSHSWIGW
jgi:hypothetical protein